MCLMQGRKIFRPFILADRARSHSKDWLRRGCDSGLIKRLFSRASARCAGDFCRPLSTEPLLPNQRGRQLAAASIEVLFAANYTSSVAANMLFVTNYTSSVTENMLFVAN